MVTMQDVLELGSEHRMNMPGVAEGNWQWRFQWKDIAPGTEAYLRNLVTVYGRKVRAAGATEDAVEESEGKQQAVEET